MDRLMLTYVTASCGEEARDMGKKLIEEGLAACVNIYDGINSIYKWEGKIENSREAVLLIKSKGSLVSELKKRIKELHSYSCPCIIVFNASDADPEYAGWVFGETRDSQ